MSSELAPKRILVVAYLFPPVGGAGVQRAVKFVKYLPDYNWLPSVLTAENPSVPVFDESLQDDIPEDTILRRARTREPGYGVKQAVVADSDADNGWSGRLWRTGKTALRQAAKLALQPDSQILWWPGAVEEGMRLLNEIQHDAIFVTGPPFSTFLVGASLARRSGLPLILDYRDEWGISNKYWEHKVREPISGWIQARMQQSVMRAASAIVATTQMSADSLGEVAEEASADVEVVPIYNGYDLDDLTVSAKAEDTKSDRYRLSYVGTLWNLTSVEPLVHAVEILATEQPELAEFLEINFAGRRVGQQEEILERLDPLPCHVIRHPYLDHSGAIQLMRDSDCLCLLLSDVPHAGRVVPAKVFEYVALKRSILSITPTGEISQLLEDCPFANTHAPSDVRGIADTLAHAIRRHLQADVPETKAWDISRFDRRNLAGELAGVLNRVVGTPHDTHPEDTQHTEELVLA
jgi:hypothetical protein